MLASGSGTILRALVDADLPIVVVIVDRPCGATAIAAGAGIPVEVVERSSFGADFDRVAYTNRIVDKGAYDLGFGFFLVFIGSVGSFVGAILMQNEARTGAAGPPRA